MIVTTLKHVMDGPLLVDGAGKQVRPDTGDITSSVNHSPTIVIIMVTMVMPMVVVPMML